MKPTHIAMLGVFGMAVLTGFLDGLHLRVEGGTKFLVEFGPSIAALVFIFMWLHYDSERHTYKRSPLMNIGIAAVGIVAIPVYLFRSRPNGRRLRAILGFLGLSVLWVLLAGFSMLLTEHVAA
jgi:hypothetical protein